MEAINNLPLPFEIYLKICLISVPGFMLLLIGMAVHAWFLRNEKSFVDYDYFNQPIQKENK